MLQPAAGPPSQSPRIDRAPQVLPAETFPAGTEHNPGVHDTLPGLSLYTHLHPAGRGLRGGRAGSGSTVEKGIFNDTHGSLGVHGDIRATSLATGLVTQQPALEGPTQSLIDLFHANETSLSGEWASSSRAHTLSKSELRHRHEATKLGKLWRLLGSQERLW